MELTTDILQKTCKEQIVGDFYPYNTGDWDETEKYIEALVGRIKGIPTLNVNADFDHFGTGTASFVEVYATKRDGSLTIARQEKTNDHLLTTETHEGLLIAISRVAPVAVMGSDKRTEKTKDGKFDSTSLSHIQSQIVDILPPGDWHNEIEQIKRLLDEFNIRLLDSFTIEQPLDFDANIRTVLNSSRTYKVFDALFYWED
jgi:hypothetical protein